MVTVYIFYIVSNKFKVLPKQKQINDTDTNTTTTANTTTITTTTNVFKLNIIKNLDYDEIQFCHHLHMSPIHYLLS
jgi:hypothetical protein